MAGIIGWTVAADDHLSSPPADYITKSWQVEDGLPQSSVTSITQTPDGYLWLGTFGGLVRFDGVHFTVFDSENTPELKSSRILRLYKDSRGALWILSERGDLSRLSDGGFKSFTATDGGLAGAISAVGEDADGRIWAVPRSLTGAFRVEQDRFSLLISPTTIPTGSPFPLGSMFGLVRDSEGNLWGGQATNLLRMAPGYPARVAVGLSGEDLGILALGSAHDGGLWVVTSAGPKKYLGGRWAKEFPSPAPILTASCILEDHEGQIWIGTWGHGLLRFSKTGGFARYAFTSLRFSETIRSLFEDSEGNIWVGLDGAGLRRLKRPTFKTYDARDGLGEDLIRSVTEDKDGNIWVATQSDVARISALPDFEIKTMRFSPGIPMTILGGRDGEVMVGTFGRGSYRYAAGEWERMELYPDWFGEPVTSALFETANGNRRAGIPGQVRGWAAGRSNPALPLLGLSIGWNGATTIRAFAEDSQGGLYAGTDGAGLWYAEGGRSIRIEGTAELPMNSIWALHADDEEALWIGTFGRGLIRLKGGKLFSFQARVPCLPRCVTSILEDRFQNLWLGSNQGIYRVARAALNQQADGGSSPVIVSRYTQSDGLATVECASGRQPVAWKAHDGRLWFATIKGLAVVDPLDLPSNPKPPPVLIEKIVYQLGGLEKALAPIAYATGGAIWTRDLPAVIEAGAERLTIFYTGLSFVAPERMRFKYRLFGAETGWMEGDGTRTASYSHLAPGRYRFQVLAANNDGVWNESGASVDLRILPSFWQTWWFSLLVVAAAGAALSALYRLRLSRIEELGSLRLSIASDLHDDVGSSLGSIALNSEWLQSNSTLSKADKQELGEINRMAIQTSQTIREMTWLINPGFDTSLEMVERMKDVAASMLTGREYHFTAPKELVGQRMTLESRRNIFLIFKEVLHNIVKHSKATRVEIMIAIEEGKLDLTVADNGAGFEADTVRRGHGLNGVARRAAALGGALSVESGPGTGTTIRLVTSLGKRG